MSFSVGFVRVLNQGEFEYSPQFLEIRKDQKGSYRNFLLPEIYWSSKKRQRYGEEVRIQFVHIVENRTQSTKSDHRSRRGGQIVGAVVAGAIGMVAMSMGGHTFWDIDLDIYLTDGRCIECTVRDESVVSLLYPFMLENKRETARTKRFGRQAKFQGPNTGAGTQVDNVYEDTVLGIQGYFKCSKKDAQRLVNNVYQQGMTIEEALLATLRRKGNET